MPLNEDDEVDVIYDQRKTNTGHPELDFSDFYQALDNLLEENGKAADERRKTETTHLPIAVSVPQLLKKVSV